MSRDLRITESIIEQIYKGGSWKKMKQTTLEKIIEQMVDIERQTRTSFKINT